METLLKRDRTLVVAGLAGITVLTWTYLVYLAQGMAGMDLSMRLSMPHMNAWTTTDLLWLFGMWTAMMVGMMVPTAAPMVLIFAAVNRKRRQQQGPFVRTAVFLLGYTLVWSGYSVLVALAQWALHDVAFLASPLADKSPIAGGILLVATGIFQWTPLKQACLSNCRSPIGFIMTEWREGNRGALTMGLRQGTFCVGCCWVLMGLMFLGGLMNLFWMAGIAAFVLVEKVLPHGQWVGKVAGALFVIWGLWMIAGPLA